MAGATLGATHCEFRVWAPLAREVQLELEAPQRSVPLTRVADGFHEIRLEDIAAGQRYRFAVDGKTLPDPWSRYQPEGPHGPSVVVDRRAFEWTDQQWKGIGLDGLVLYELHIGTFTPEGTFAAAAGKLAYLRTLGVTAIEVMPIAECPGTFNWGYDGVGWFAPSHNYGPYDALKGFVDAAHALGIGVILDVVYNHFGPDGNYLGLLSAHYLSDKGTEWGESINYDGEGSGPVREMVVQNACEWIREFHLDGLRLDATQSIFDQSQPHLLTELASAARAAAGSRRILIIAENEPQHASHLQAVDSGGLGLDAMWNDDFHHSAMVAATGQRNAYYRDYFGAPQEFISASKRGFLFQGQVYRWQKQPRGEPLAGAARQCVAFLQNHDQVANSLTGARLHQLASPGVCRALTALLLLGPQTPLLFMGQEFHASAPFLFFADHAEPLRGQVLKGRGEFLSQFQGANSADGRAAIAEPGAAGTFERCKLDWSECQPDNPALRLHADLLALRRDDVVLRRQGADGFDGAVLTEQAFLLRWLHPAGEDRLLIVNLGTEIWDRPMPEPLLAPPLHSTWRLLWSSEHVGYGGNGTVNPDTPEGWQLPAQCAVLLGAEAKAPP